MKSGLHALEGPLQLMHLPREALARRGLRLWNNDPGDRLPRKSASFDALAAILRVGKPEAVVLTH